MEIGGQSAAGGHLWVPRVAGMKAGTLPRGCQRKRGWWLGLVSGEVEEVAGALSSTKVH